MTAKSATNWNPNAHLGARADAILAHEMEHARHETQGTMARGTFTVGTEADATYVDKHGNQGIANYERQAVGLSRSDTPGGVPAGGHYPGDPDGCTENTYRDERNQLGLGDRFLPRGQYTSPWTQERADRWWQTHLPHLLRETTIEAKTAALATA